MLPLVILIVLGGFWGVMLGMGKIAIPLGVPPIAFAFWTCVGGAVCDMFFDPVSFRGGFECLPPGSDQIGDFCSSNVACEAFCAQGTISGFFDFGVCSECATDADCANGGTCSEPTLDILTGIATPATCG